MRFLPASEMRALDRAAIESGTPGWTLMRRAGAAVARAAARLADIRGTRHILVAAGRGNNGGDCCVAAALLHSSGYSVRLRLASDPSALSGDAALAFDFLRKSGAPFSVLPAPEDWDALDDCDLPCPGFVLVDALLGTGSHGAPRGSIAAAIGWLRRAQSRASHSARARNLLLAVDIPSGLDADTGAVADTHVDADFTLTLAAPKTAFSIPSAFPALGHVEVADIGLPPQRESSPDALELIAPSEFPDPDAPRAHDAHKGSFGHVLVIGGSRGFAGAPALAALGALRSGAGLVSATVPDGCAAQLAAHAPEAMAHQLPAPDGWLTRGALEGWGRDLASFDAVVIGPGLRANADTAELVRALVSDTRIRRILLDADALNVIAPLPQKNGAPLFDDPSRAILTPHPGEAARLLGVSTSAVQADRQSAARELALRANATVVLKGAGTLVAAPGMPLMLNLTGNPGMATGGSGDILSGIIAALWAGGIDARTAAALGVHRHGCNGDTAAWRIGQRALLARDLAVGI